MPLESTVFSVEAKKELVTFRRQYLQRFDVKQLQYPSSDLLALWELQEWLWRIVDHAQKHQPYASYDKLFLKTLQLKLEDAVKDVAEPDILDSFAELYASLIAIADNTPNDHYVWTKYTAPWEAEDLNSIEQGIYILEKPSVLAASGSTGHRTWEAAMALGSCLDRPELLTHVKNRNVLELGAGTGLTSFVCAKLGASHITATDGDEAVIKRLQLSEPRNLVHNSTSTFDCRVFQWASDVSELGFHFDTVLATDVTYDASIVPDLVQTLFDLAVAHPSVSIIISASIRNPKTLIYFQETCENRGLIVTPLTLHYAIADDAMRERNGFYYSSRVPIEFFRVIRG